jgi:type II secretory ATPase GspE/PulE/Tfp pilus assembly ATPase PilB-like protein
MRLYTDQELYEALIELDLLPSEKLKEVYLRSKGSKLSFEKSLFATDLISDSNLGKVVADLISYPFVDLGEVVVEKDALDLIPEIYAKKQKVIAFKKDKEGLHIAMNDPSKKETPGFIEKKTGIPVKVYYATKRSMAGALAFYAKDIKEAFSDIIFENVEEAKKTNQLEPSIIKIVDTIVQYAYQNKASDIHIEPADTESFVRFRIDGVLHDVVSLPIDIHSQVVTRIKVLAKLRTDEHQTPQDGKIVISVEEDDVDIRVSIVPLTDGEKVVLRLLSARSRQYSLADLGFASHDLKKVEEAYQRPHGMILSTGPTGSGKTTTLYAILKLLNKRNINITTIEDPVEYDIEGVNQIQVNQQTNLVFATGLRSIVRQDPDIILVGEIRDEETAGISINAAMTGHLVLSTLHTNDAATTIPRLLDFGVEPYLIASTVNIIIAQRLVRRICVKCRVSQEVPLVGSAANGVLSDNMLELLRKYSDDKQIRIYRGKGCPVCHNSGYTGREGIYEVMLIDEEIRQAIIAKRDASEIKKIAEKNGMQTMFKHGLDKVKQGITSIEEVVRVTKD